jgi:hypothetical protein
MEGFTKYLEVKDEKQHGVTLFSDMQHEGHGSGEMKASVQRLVPHTGSIKFSDAMYDPCKSLPLIIFSSTPEY